MTIPVVPTSIQHTFSPHQPPAPHFWLLFYNGRCSLLSLASPRVPTFPLPSMSNFRMFFIKQTSVSIVYGILCIHDLSIYTLVLCHRFSKSFSFLYPPSHFLKTDHEGKIECEASSASVGIFMRVTRYYLTSAFSEHLWASDSSSTSWK